MHIPPTPPLWFRVRWHHHLGVCKATSLGALGHYALRTPTLELSRGLDCVRPQSTCARCWSPRGRPPGVHRAPARVTLTQPLPAAHPPAKGGGPEVIAATGLPAVPPGVLRASSEDSCPDLSGHTSQGPVWSEECQMFLNTVAVMSPQTETETWKLLGLGTASPP